MQNKRNQRSKFTLLIMSIGLVSGSNLYADGFYTIIGPDGRPMIVPKKEERMEQALPKNHREHQSNISTQPVISNKDQFVVKKTTEENVLKQQPQNESLVTKEESISTKTYEPMNSIASDGANKIISKDHLDSKAIIEKSITLPASNINNKKIQEQAVVAVNSKNTSEPKVQAVTNVDGVEYVNSEYLEDQEFNLEGKKRFYVMPDGSGRLETVERKKGVSRSMLDRIMNRTPQSDKAIVLSENYIRLSTQDLALAFENDRCFIENYSKSIKKLKPQKELGLWPRKPVKEKFEYELVELDPSTEYIQIESYASNNEKPNYYWPLIIFLDDKGCIQEGVSGFKSANNSATLFQHAAIQGVIKIPSNAHYMMMTPLASAVDVPENELSNQGQLRVSVLK
ncbi:MULTISPECIES: putative pilus assembly protein FilE [Acinetobacter]|uniref:putative pilus assembly protein FilE n=1 Tax=Acinetobacter TaxID=469 RepID=UPI000C451EA9|nr:MULTISPECIES: putative pilus assembly protein FilE [unclassified Acinetobacter]MBC68696.1 flagellar protein FilE [Acinetobacter sp.]MBT51169.1 flagellar protein FilE [Acinetobacter sp.]